MRPALVVLILLMAGCASPAATPDTSGEEALGASAALRQVDVDFSFEMTGACVQDPVDGSCPGVGDRLVVTSPRQGLRGTIVAADLDVTATRSQGSFHIALVVGSGAGCAERPCDGNWKGHGVANANLTIPAHVEFRDLLDARGPRLEFEVMVAAGPPGGPVQPFLVEDGHVRGRVWILPDAEDCATGCLET